MTDHSTDSKHWQEVIVPSHSIFTLNISELWKYRDLMVIWMRRDILSIYSQTVLGPLWFFLQPILTTLTYLIIFSRIAKLSTIDMPPVLFYMSGSILWGYFSECILKTSTFLKDNSGLFSKVYFPRLIIPISIVFTNLVKLGIQLGLFLLVYGYYFFTSSTIHPGPILLVLPLLILMIAFLGLGSGLITSSLTTRYKDLSHLINFSVQLLSFLSPVFFPVDKMQDSVYRKIILANPMTGVIEAFRYGFTGKGFFSWQLLGYDAAIAVALLFTGILLFNSVEKNFVDTI
ncbi:MAG: ABC transporter permease [Chitinophagaceae bacterium]|nr:ABC transporter permease [Chitinophagaceae bacterium]